MKQELLSAKIELPEKVSCNYKDYILTIKGPKGEIKRKIFHPRLNIAIDNSSVVFSFKNATKREKKIIYSYVAHLKNMVKGVTRGHIYKLKICSGHFPMTVTYKNNVFEVKNFFGETIPRRVMINCDAKISINGNEIVVESISKEEAGQVAATIEQLTRRTGFDRRRFQDGIYIIEKDGKKIEE
ncbi:MAG: 50S ribosomal protein L6 [Candidatus Woesearchaeota archaeon]